MKSRNIRGAGRGGPSAASKTLARVHEQQALDLRIKGYSYTRIGAELEMTQQSARACVKRVLDKLIAETREQAEEVREIECVRLDEMLDGVWDDATSGDPRAIEVTLKIMDRRAKLYGLDAPLKQELSGPDGGPIAIEDARAVLAAKLAQLTDPTAASPAVAADPEPAFGDGDDSAA